MNSDLTLSEKIFYICSILLGCILIKIVTPFEQFPQFWANEQATGYKLSIFCIIATALCYTLHFRKMALWIVGHKSKNSSNPNTRWIMDDVIAFAALFIQGVIAATWIVAFASLLFQLYLLLYALIMRKKAISKLPQNAPKPAPFPYWQVLYAFTNPFNKIIIMVPSGVLYEMLKGKELCSGQTLLAAVIALLVYFSIATVISSITIVFRQQRSFSEIKSIFTENYADITIYILMLFPLGALIALIYIKEPAGLFILPLPLIAMHRAMKNIEVIFDEYKEFIYSLAYAIDARDHYTYGHSERVALYSRAIGEYMHLSERELDNIERAGKIHDLGKITIPDSILHKPGKLNDSEYDVMKTHINALQSHFANKKRLSEILPIEMAAAHHERFDGKGYVIGKSGEEIPLGARILAVADVFDALTTDRPYRSGLDAATALKYIKDGSGTHFDPNITKYFEEMFRKGLIEQLMKKDIERIDK